jgi:hypothetical protein
MNLVTAFAVHVTRMCQSKIHLIYSVPDKAVHLMVYHTETVACTKTRSHTGIICSYAGKGSYIVKTIVFINNLYFTIREIYLSPQFLTLIDRFLILLTQMFSILNGYIDTRLTQRY